MSFRFQIGVKPTPEILTKPPPQFSEVPFIYCPIAVRVNADGFPTAFWCDFAGVLLYKWYRQVWKMSQYESRSARLVFWYTYEIWLRRTTKHWWNVSFVERNLKDKRIMEEHLVIPECVEAALLTAIQRLLAGARRVSVWTEDCEALEQALNDPERYWAALEAGDIPPPSFISGRLIPDPSLNQSMPRLNLPPSPKRNGGSRSPNSNALLPKQREQRGFAPLPIFCPQCNAVLRPWGEEAQQTCPLCRYEIRIG